MSNLPISGGIPPQSEKPRAFHGAEANKPIVTLPTQVKLTTVTATGEHLSLHASSSLPKTVNLLPKTASMPTMLEGLPGTIQHLPKSIAQPSTFQQISLPPSGSQQQQPANSSLQSPGQPVLTPSGHALNQHHLIQPTISQTLGSLPIIQHSLSNTRQGSPLLTREHVIHSVQPGPISLTAQPGPTQPGPISLTQQAVVHSAQPGPAQPGPISLTPQTVTMASIIRAPTTVLPPKNPFQAQVLKGAPTIHKHTVLRPAQSPIVRKPTTPPIISSALATPDIRSVSTTTTAQTVQITIQAKGETNVVRGPAVRPVHLATVPKTTAVIHHPVIGSIAKQALSSGVGSIYGQTVTTASTIGQAPVAVTKLPQRGGQHDYSTTPDSTSTPPVTDSTQRHDRPMMNFELPGFPGASYLYQQFFPPISGLQAPRQYLQGNVAATIQGLAHNMPPTNSVRLSSNPMVTPRHTVSQVLTSVGDGTLTSSENVLTVVAPSNQVSSAISPGAGSAGLGPNASPRPSILRKRTIEGCSVVRKTIPTPTGSETGSPRPESAPRSATNSPKPAGFLERDANSQSSTDTATSDGPPSLNSSMDVVTVKTEPVESLIESGNTSNISSAQHSVESSPRKKPRKQLLHVSEELKDHHSSTDDDAEGKMCIKEEDQEKPDEKQEFVDGDGIHWVAMRKRNSSALLNSFNIHWKARNNHFLRYSDVKPKEERRPTVNELSNQKGIQQKASGWKLFHLATQLDEVKCVEKETLSDMSAMQQCIEQKVPRHSEYGNRIHELMQANKQRLKLVIDQVDEAKNSLLKILDHKTRIQEIISKHHSKRQVKKKERT